MLLLVIQSGLAYMGSRTLKQLARSGLIVPVTIPEDQQAMYQPGILNTVSDGGQTWGFPHAFSTKALFINCGLVEEAGWLVLLLRLGQECTIWLKLLMIIPQLQVLA